MVIESRFTVLGLAPAVKTDAISAIIANMLRSLNIMLLCRIYNLFRFEKLLLEIVRYIKTLPLATTCF